jgi:capsule polysaccharide export protein KpsE/RkpR
MQQWKLAGPAPRDIDDALWKRFRGAQDAFFAARDAENAALDEEFAANATVKEALLVEAEALLPRINSEQKDLDAAKKTFRDIAERWEAAGKVPRDRIKDLEGRLRKVETALRGVEDEQWKKSDPEKSARADGMVAQLEKAIADLQADLDKARAAGNDKKVRDLEDNIAGRTQFLEMAKKVSSEFSG